MAFQMIPPRMSSSPPPFDSLPTITCHQEDEDDDFADYSGGHNASFDITGLSDKLPPTPTSSPTKTFPSITQCMVANSDQLNEKVTEDSISEDLDGNKENQTSEFSHKLSSENEKCGDFQSSISVISNVNGEEAGDSKEETEEKLLNSDDDFGDFECFPGENERPLGNNFQGAVIEENMKNMTNFKEESTENGAIIDSSSQILASSVSKDGQMGTSDSESPPCFRSTVVSNLNDWSPSRSPPPTIVSPPRSPPPRSPPLRSPPPTMVSPPPLDKLAPRRMSEENEDEFGDFTTGHLGIMEDEDDDFGDFTSTNINSLPTNCDSNDTIISSNINLVSPSCHEELIENKESKVNKINSINRSIGLSSEQLENCTDSEVKENSKVDIEVDKVLSEDNSTVLGEDRQSTEELTEERFSDEILPNQNQIIKNSSVKNNIEISNDARTLELEVTNKLDTPFVENNTVDSTNENGLHESYKSDNDDDFGDFEGNFEQPNEVKSYDDDNDFDDFVSPENVIDDIRTTTSENLNNDLESLLLRWIPPISKDVKTSDNNTKRLQQVVKEDAFIWHQLEDLDSSPAINLAWPQSHAQKLFLSSVNVDARNILFGQKWSTSVPLFAQTLTFSPLTPAKHIESTEECLQSQNLTTKCPQKPAEDTVGASKSGEVRTKGEDTEEKIPEAKFDWTSSGLTNPLESTAYNTSLFELDFLLTASSMGKGATNSVLTSLEREFLSESSSKSGRVKAPPSPSPLVQQILSGGTVGGGAGSSLSSRNATSVTQINSLQPEVQQIVAKLPDLNFMKSRVLMFPIKGEQL